MSNELFNACATGGGFMFFSGLLLLAALVLGIAALVKYLFWSDPGSGPHAGHLAPPPSGTSGDKAWLA